MRIDKKQFAVIGLGRFGMALCEELMDQGAQVLALDVNERCVKAAAEIASHAIVADCSNEETVSELKLDEYDIVMVAIGEDMQSSILTSLVLKEMGVKNVWVKAKDKFHGKILNKIGVDKVISPERDMGMRIARSMLHQRVFDFLLLGSGLAIAEVVIGGIFSGRELSDHPCAQDEHLKVLAYKRGPNIHESPGKTMRLEMGDILIVVGDEVVLQEQLKLL